MIHQRRLQQGWHPEIPDFAIDKHTSRGKSMGRGWTHWFEDGCRLSPEPPKNLYQDEAERLWPTSKKNDKGTTGKTATTRGEGLPFDQDED